MFWTLAPPEIYAALEAYNARERQADLRAGLIAATLVNVNRAAGTSPVSPEDFFRRRLTPEDYMTVAEAKAAMDSWAAGQNANLADGAAE